MVSCASCRFIVFAWYIRYVQNPAASLSPVSFEILPGLREPGKDIVAVENSHKGHTVKDREPAHIVVDHEPCRIG